MPDWVHNHLSLKHDDQRVLHIAISAWNMNKFFATLIPEPVELTTKTTPPDPSEDYRKDMELLNWRLSNWGTKWDIDNEAQIIPSDADSFKVSFGSAWTPPLAAYQRLSELGFQIEASYFSPDKRTVGCLSSEDGYVDQFIEEWSEKWLMSNILPKLIEDFELIELCHFFGELECDEEDDACLRHVEELHLISTSEIIDKLTCQK